jgi:hypothetical protein
MYNTEKVKSFQNDLYNTEKVKSFQNDLLIFYAIYNISAMKMHQLHGQIGGELIGVFTDSIVVEGDIKRLNVINILLMESEQQILKNSLN